MLNKRETEKFVENWFKRYSPTLAIILIFTALFPPTATAAEDWAEPARVAAVEAGELTEANALWWGFDEADSTRFLQAAINSPASRLVIPKQDTPWVVEPLFIERDGLELFFEAGTVIEARRGAFRGRIDCLFLVRDQQDIVFNGYGATFRMHKYDYWEEPYQRSEWRHALSLRGAVNVKVLGLRLEDSGGGGIYVGRGQDRDYCENIVVRDVICDNNNRQGMSIVSVDRILVENSLFMNTIGTAPMAGIDCETHRPEERLSNVVIRNCMFIGNSQLGMHNWPGRQTAESAPVSILWENNYVRGSVVGIQVAAVGPETPEGEIVFRNNIIEGSHFAGIMIRRVSAESQLRIAFSGNLLINTARGDYPESEIKWYEERGYDRFDGWENPGSWYGRHGCPSAPIVLTAQSDGPAVQGNISFDNDVIISNLDRPAVVVGGPWGVEHSEMFGPDGEPAEGGFQGWRNVSGTIRVVNPYGGRIEIQTPVDNFTLKIE